MVQNSFQVAVFFITYPAFRFSAVLVFVCDYKITLRFKVCFIYCFYGTIRDFFFFAEDKLVFVGDKFLVPDCEQI